MDRNVTCGFNYSRRQEAIDFGICLNFIERSNYLFVNLTFGIFNTKTSKYKSDITRYNYNSIGLLLIDYRGTSELEPAGARFL